MILKVIDENNFILFIIDKNVVPKLEEDNITNYLKKTFVKLKKMFNIEVYGYYDVVIYLDEYYGMIIKLIREELEYLSYYGKQIEMKIIISDNQVLYKIDNIYDIDKRIIEKCNVLLDFNQIFLELKENINFILLGNLIENSEIIFENTDEIKKRSEKIEIR